VEEAQAVLKAWRSVVMDAMVALHAAIDEIDSRV
jgi:hypothetical protein